ncbi:hypothetical protein MNBD_ALPHA01-281 [hydrothermal vent metagenome]|uniref:Uncharacterized protein n=1 Tax=hydrothermal vent metagenome TaxID=652676 RepID=A0A3B0SN03_9ZZZZ
MVKYLGTRLYFTNESIIRMRLNILYGTAAIVILLIVISLRGIIFSGVAYADGGNMRLPHRVVEHHDEVNLEHFNHLFMAVEIGQRKMAVVNIYSEFPDYLYAIEPNEGFACVDDAARAIVMLSEYIKRHPSDEIKHKIKLLVEFILYMQNDNGYFNNFIWHDLSINTSYRTSIAEMNWWSFRALWSLEVAHDLVAFDADLTGRIEKAVDKAMVRIKRDLAAPHHKIENVETISLPTWLPGKYAADQSAVAIIALLPYYKRSADAQIPLIIDGLARGIMQMQKGDENNFPYGMFLSWKNNWHAWGNSQAYALLLAGRQLDRKDYIRSALREIDYFYPYLLRQGFPGSISIRREAGIFVKAGEQSFPQIAYGIRPMVFALSEAYNITGDKKYSARLAEVKSWFTGNNRAAEIIYDRKSGRTYDAIVSPSGINMNSGAESTIEGLLVRLR